MADEPLSPELYETLVQRPGETARAHTAFLDYVRLGPGRSLRKLCQGYRGQSEGEAGAETPPTRRLATLEVWSVRFEWQARLLAYRQERDAGDQERWEQRRREVRESDWVMSQELRQLVSQALAQMPQFMKTTRRLVKGRDGEPDREVITVQQDLAALLRALEVTSKLQRLAAEMAQPVQEHKVMGAVVNVTADDLVDARRKAEALEQMLLGGDSDSDNDGTGGET